MCANQTQFAVFVRPWKGMALVAEGVRKSGYRGPITLPAEYSAEREVNRLIVADLAYAQESFD